jgi:uncharacterized protein YjbI with pentapeptide repeats
MIVNETVLKNFNACTSLRNRFVAQHPNGFDISGLWGTDEEAQAVWAILFASEWKTQIGWAISVGLLPARIRANLSRADLSRADLSRADLSRADLSGANLRWADLSGANLRWANLRWADLRWADLRWADLSGADLSGADLSGADLSGADLRWADLSRALTEDAVGL